MSTTTRRAGWIQKDDGSGLEPLIIEADQKLDTAGIVGEELARLGYPLPVEVANAGPRGVDDRSRI